MSPAEKAYHAARNQAIQAARLAAETRCHNVVVLDLTGLSPIADFFVIATGTSATQMRAVCNQLEAQSGSTGAGARSRSGYEGETWYVLDFVDVVVHLFSQEARAYYDLDNLWGDARIVEWREPSAAATATNAP